VSTVLVVTAVVCTLLAAVRGTWSPCGLSMVSAMNPFSERSRGHSYPVTCVLFVLGAALGGVLLGALAAGAAAVVRPLVDGRPAAALLVGLLLAAVALASEVRLGGFALPVHPRQVDEQWLSSYRRWVYAAGFGLQIGAGFTTYIMTAATYLFVALAVLTGSPLLALATGLLFGVVRGLAVTLSAGATDPARLRALHRRLDRWTAPSVAVAVMVLAAVVVTLATALLGPIGLTTATAAVVVVLASTQGGRDAVRALVPGTPAVATAGSRPAA
jgi:hypothetical protein